MSTKRNIDWRNPAHLLAFGFGAGLAPRAPGTFGTLLALPLYALMQPLALPMYLAALAALFGIGVVVCGRAARDMGVHDDPAIVWDEVVGYLIAMAFAPVGWVAAVAGFVLFRAMDILKPWPIGWADRRVGGGFGIMLDDVMAGVYAGLVLHLGARWIA
jgi:phosphatidylglycerophosphatase A